MREVVINGQPETVIVSKVFDNADFGYRKITVERPLRLKFQVSPERLNALREATAFQNLAKSKKKDKKTREAEEAKGRELQEAVIAVLESLAPQRIWMSRDEFLTDLESAAARAGVPISAPIRKAIVGAIGERDENAEICRDAEGNPEPDPELRDYENVPLKQDVHEYFQREVRPHMPDAWINEDVRDEQDGQVGKVGYEIPLTRHFYVYNPPRPLAEIEADIKGVERDIVRMLAEVTGSSREEIAS